MLAIWISTLGEEPPTGAYPKIDSLEYTEPHCLEM